MRISLLEKRENFSEVLESSLKSNTFIDVSSQKKSVYYVHKYLNFVATKELSTTVFQPLVNEYSSAIKWWKKLLQYAYVNISISKIFRARFSQESLLLPEAYRDYLILGGNHRIRLFSCDLAYSTVILKVGEQNKFISNDIYCRTNYKLQYSPQIIDYGIDWIKEEYFNGTPINRISNFCSNDLRLIIQTHLEGLIHPSSNTISLNEFRHMVLGEVNEILHNPKIKLSEQRQKSISLRFDALFENVKSKDILTSWSHGDFQHANILMNKSKTINVIDWEAASRRFKFYDVYTLISAIRTGLPLTQVFDKIQNEVSRLSLNIPFNKECFVLFLIEELRFYINEEFCENYFETGRKTIHLCEQISYYLNE